jgi:outer membrane protein TolC
MIRGRWIALLHAALAIIVTGLPLAAQETPRPYTVSGLVERALGRFELIASRESVVRQRLALERQALRWRNPELGFELGRKTADGVSGRAYGVSITQHIPLFGRRSLAAEIERFERNRAALDRDGIRLFVRYEVVRLAYDYLRAYRRAAHIRGRLERLRLINSYMKGRIIVPPQKIVEKRIIEYRVAALEQDLYATDRELRSAYARLNLYTGFEDDDPPPVSAPWFVRAPALELNDLLAKSRERSFAVRMRQEALKAARGMTALAAREPYPDIGVSFFYHREEAGPAESVFGGGVSFPVPVLSRNGKEWSSRARRAESRRSWRSIRAGRSRPVSATCSPGTRYPRRKSPVFPFQAGASWSGPCATPTRSSAGAG